MLREGVVDALKRAELRIGDVLSLTPFRGVRSSSHTFEEGVQATLWTCGAALELRRCPEA